MPGNATGNTYCLYWYIRLDSKSSVFFLAPKTTSTLLLKPAIQFHKKWYLPMFSSYGWWKESCTSWYGKYPIIFAVLYIPGGAGFLVSTVCFQGSSILFGFFSRFFLSWRGFSCQLGKLVSFRVQTSVESVGNFTDRDFFLRKSRNNSFFHILGGGFNFFWCSPLLGEMIQFD